MLLNNRPKGISLNKNAANIQANNLQQQQSLLNAKQLPHQQLPHGKSSKTPSPPQLKSLKQRVENENDLQMLFATHQQQLKDLDQPLKPQAVAATTAAPVQLHQLELLQPAQAYNNQTKQPALRETKQYDIQKLLQQQQQPTAAVAPKPLQVHQQPSLRPQGLKRERPKSMIPRPVGSKVAEREVSKREEKVEDIDENRDDIFYVSDIAPDIYNYMFQLEDSMAIKRDHLRGQAIYTSKIRQRLVTWCIEIHTQLKLIPETMYTTISILDRYFQVVQVKHQNQVQLIGVAATLIASKYEEIYPPEIDDLIHLTRNAYSKRDILRQEIEILEKLKFDLGKPIPLAFLRRFSRAAHCDVKMHSIAKWLMEQSLPHYECSHWKPSQLAAAALFTTLYLIHRDNTFSCWNKTLIHYTNYSRQQLMEPAATLCKIVKRVAPNTKYAELRSIHVDQLIKICEQQQQ